MVDKILTISFKFCGNTKHGVQAVLGLLERQISQADASTTSLLSHTLCVIRSQPCIFYAGWERTPTFAPFHLQLLSPSRFRRQKVIPKGD